MHDVPFVDAHFHLWNLELIDYPWLKPPFSEDGPNGSVETIATDYLLSDYARDLEGWNIVGAVHVDAGADPAAALTETVWLEEQAASSALPTVIVAHSDLGSPTARNALRAQTAHRRVRGIRQILNWHPESRRSYTARDLTVDESWRSGFAVLGTFDLSFDLQCYPGQMPALATLIERHPEIPIVINHLGMPVLSDADGLKEWRRGMLALASIEHVHVKISGLGFIRRGWTRDEVEPFVRGAIDMFGPGRCMMASDMPTDKLFAPPGKYLETYRMLLADYTDEEVRAMLGRNANRVYRLGLSI